MHDWQKKEEKSVKSFNSFSSVAHKIVLDSSLHFKKRIRKRFDFHSAALYKKIREKLRFSCLPCEWSERDLNKIFHDFGSHLDDRCVHLMAQLSCAFCL